MKCPRRRCFAIWRSSTRAARTLAEAGAALLRARRRERTQRFERLRSRGVRRLSRQPIRQTTLMRELARGAQTAFRPVSAAGSRAAPASSAVAVKAGPKLRILLAEDNQINAVLATALIRRAGHHVDVAINGLEAIDAAKAENTISFSWTCTCRRWTGSKRRGGYAISTARSPRFPIIALTANAMASDRQKCVAAGMDDFCRSRSTPPISTPFSTNGRGEGKTARRRVVTQVPQALEDQPNQAARSRRSPASGARAARCTE